MLRAALGADFAAADAGDLFAGILLGIATPTEVAAFAVVYGLRAGDAGLSRNELARFMRTVLDTAALTGVLLFIFAAASGFSWTLTVAYLPQRLVALLQRLGDSTAIFMSARSCC